MALQWEIGVGGMVFRFTSSQLGRKVVCGLPTVIDVRFPRPRFVRIRAGKDFLALRLTRNIERKSHWTKRLK
jgi:hypothetical protein